ncbi:neurofilament heavy polypeptide-like [Palaemon carinicauda]|uniref:neurofilament heavy polypeptide-like n=1 Tax=Palaemon carinicauda TaxID=392227 RepID=UPI0035B686A7
MRKCPGLPDRPCGTYMSAIDTDPHTLCLYCRGQRCDSNNVCGECREWSTSQWERFSRRWKKSKRDISLSKVSFKRENPKDSSSVAQTSSEAPTRSASPERSSSGSVGRISVARSRGLGEGVASHSEAAPPPSPGEDLIISPNFNVNFSNKDLLQLWASLGLQGSPSKEALFDIIRLGAAVKQSPTVAEVDPLSIVDVVVAEASNESVQTSAPVADAAEGLVPTSEHPSREKLSPTVSPGGESPLRGSSLTETPLRRTADGLPAASRGRIRRKARLPLRGQGLPSPHKGVRRRLFVLSSSQSAAEEPRPSMTVPATSLDLDLSADRSRSPSPARPADLPSPFLAADALWAPTHPVIKRATVPSGQKELSHIVCKSLKHQVSPARQRSPARQCAIAHKRSPAVAETSRQRSPVRASAVPETTRQSSPARPRATAHPYPDARLACPRFPARQRSPVRQQSPARPRSSDLGVKGKTSSSPARQHSPARHRMPTRQRTPPARHPSPTRHRPQSASRAHAPPARPSDARPLARDIYLARAGPTESPSRALRDPVRKLLPRHAQTLIQPAVPERAPARHRSPAGPRAPSPMRLRAPSPARHRSPTRPRLRAIAHLRTNALPRLRSITRPRALAIRDSQRVLTREAEGQRAARASSSRSPPHKRRTARSPEGGRTPDRSRNFPSTAAASFQADPAVVSTPRDRTIPFPPEGISDSAAVSRQPWFGSLVRAMVQAFKPAFSELGLKSAAVSAPLKRKREVDDVVTSPRAKLAPRKSLRKAPSQSSRVEVNSLPPSLLESCIPPRRESKDSKMVPKSSSRIRPEPAQPAENVHKSPQEEPSGMGDFAASPSGGEPQELEHGFWQVLTLMRNLNGFEDPEIPPREGKDTVLDRVFGTRKPPKASAALPWSRGVRSARDKVESQLSELAASSRSSAGNKLLPPPRVHQRRYYEIMKESCLALPLHHSVEELTRGVPLERLSNRQVSFSAAEIRSQEKVAKCAMQATSWLDIWLGSLGILLRSEDLSKESTRKALETFLLSGTRTIEFLAHQVSNLWANSILKRRDAVSERFNTKVSSNEVSKLRHSSILGSSLFEPKDVEQAAERWRKSNQDSLLHRALTSKPY